MKRGLAAVFAFTLLMNFAFVYAADCADNEVIMRLSSATNAHASLWGESTYSEKICYDDIFETTYDIPEDSELQDTHRCTRLNQMLFLEKSKNSHASTVWDYDVYNEEVCYGNLQCFFDESEGDSCEQGLLTAKMYRKENSHMENSDQENYPVKVCCSNVYMTNTNYEIINQANVEDTVYFVSPPGFSEIEIKVDGFWFFDSEVDKIESYYDEELMANIIEWQIPGDVITGNETELIVKITGPNGETTLTSEFDITVYSSRVDDPAEVEILSLECADNFTVGSQIPIVVSASDADDVLDGMIYINGVPQEGGEFTNGGTSITYDADTAGEVKIEVNATNNKGLSTSYIANIMVLDYSVDSNYTAACIASPVNFQDFDDTLVNFDASTTRGIIIEDGIAYELKPGSHPFIWYWEFEGTPVRGGTVSETYSNAQSQDYYNDEYYLFQLKYPGAGVKKADLRVELPAEAWEVL